MKRISMSAQQGDQTGRQATGETAENAKLAVYCHVWALLTFAHIFSKMYGGGGINLSADAIRRLEQRNRRDLVIYCLIQPPLCCHQNLIPFRGKLNAREVNLYSI